ncbi:MAG: arginine--tRNA ligase [Candidatus Micrarchaeota archaeon]|nr:arginine--tRNA ligase [Candidatus Micrarchaeota archaeon]
MGVLIEYSSPSTIAKTEFSKIIKKSVRSSFSLDLSEEEVKATIDIPKNSMGDISTSIAFKLAKELKKNPKEIAFEIANHLEKTDLIPNTMELNGYLNGIFNESMYSKLVLEAVAKDQNKYGMSEEGVGKKVIVEFASVNPNKPWHVGHLRNALLGDFVSNILEFSSHQVERENYIDDLGLQMAESLWGLRNFNAIPNEKYDQWIGKQYVEVNKKLLEPNSQVNKEIKDMLKRMEDLDSTESVEVRTMAEKCVKAQLETSANYGIYHDVMIWESDVVRQKLLEKALEFATKNGILEKPSEGKYANSTVVPMYKIAKYVKEFAGNEEEAKVIVRSNGAATYIAKDFAFHMWKFGLVEDSFRYEKFNTQFNGKPLYTTSASGSKMEFGNVTNAINIIGSAQRVEQQIMKSMFSLLNEDKIAKGIVHLSYGEVEIKDSNLSTRSGAWLGKDKNYTADDLLKEATEKASIIVTKSEKINDKNSISSISKSVALAAIKFEFLKYALESKIVFTWEKSLNFEGDSGPYCLYSYARAVRVLEKSGFIVSPHKITELKGITRGEDFELVKHIGNFSSVIEKANLEYRPNLLTDYALTLAALFGKFYKNMPILKEGEARDLRILLTYAVKQTMENTLRLLGIVPIERM